MFIEKWLCQYFRVVINLEHTSGTVRLTVLPKVLQFAFSPRANALGQLQLKDLWQNCQYDGPSVRPTYLYYYVINIIIKSLQGKFEPIVVITHSVPDSVILPSFDIATFHTQAFAAVHYILKGGSTSQQNNPVFSPLEPILGKLMSHVLKMKGHGISINTTNSMQNVTQNRSENGQDFNCEAI